MPTPEEPLSPTGHDPSASGPPTREEVVAIVARAHLGSVPGQSALAAQTLASCSKLPKRVAENLGAGFGQWDFFPEISDIVDFAIAYVPPSNEEEMWALAKAWAADDAAKRPTLLALVGHEILDLELRRIEIPKLRELVDERRPARANELRASLGLDVRPERKAAAARAKRDPAAPKATGAPGATRTPGTIPSRMPRPERRAPKVVEAKAVRRFTHPKFGTGVLQTADGEGADAKLTIKFDAGVKTLLARFVTEEPAG